jgi:hypothetical protein
LLGVLDLAKAQQRARDADLSTGPSADSNGKPHDS